MTDKRKIKQQKSNKKRLKSTEEGSPRNEFRKKDKSGEGHPTHIYKKVGKTYVFIGITHSNVTRGVKNIKLDKNPNPNDKQDAYIKPAPERASIRDFRNKPEKDWQFAKSDLHKVEEVKKKQVKDSSRKKK